MIALLLACVGATEVGPATLEGTHAAVPGLSLRLELPTEGRWSATDFAGGLPATVLEGHLADVDLALTAHLPPPGLRARLDGAGSLDLLLALAPPAAIEAPLQRLSACHGAVEQRLPGLTRIGWASGQGLAVLYAWGPGDHAAAARRVACGSLP